MKKVMLKKARLAARTKDGAMQYCMADTVAWIDDNRYAYFIKLGEVEDVNVKSKAKPKPTPEPEPEYEGPDAPEDDQPDL